MFLAVQLGASQGGEGGSGSEDHSQGAGEVPGWPPHVCGQTGWWSGVLQGTDRNICLHVIGFRFYKKWYWLTWTRSGNI